ncbi:class I SAM-dependent methyltransferase [Leptospira santarosai]|uniref:Methyltransferase domain protein n=2 Tax=Leptospira santarosai TaxID=28183 RepID=M6UMI2_9LEPT|nr:class I SAM-dependent methyltransferase [Leptospira santarosai]EMN20728.1 methyltransferase domain protein [Leptospira santarosai serovar Arenal str. MAVJ 401]EMO45795.1 methyltransferase domain protein [Leptospira santarosai str. ZUN179]MDI7182275.1 class I SAM-dependent methyltransferase [Leptospira santarosai]MDI7237703.1 class I SAM-dependent methyltransferase [Leptospira santarosai]
MECYLCKSVSRNKREGRVRDNPELDIWECNGCGLVYLSSLNHITEHHYENSGMHGSEVVSVLSWLRESDADDERRYNFLRSKLMDKRLLDFGCGAGGFLLKALKETSISEGIELELRLQEHYKEKGLKVWTNLEKVINANRKFDIITAFHVIEHLTDPRKTISQLASMLSDDGELIIEVPNSNDALLVLYESDAFSKFTYWSQHLFLFNNDTLAKLIKQSGLKLNWIKQVQRYSLSNHLYWLSKKKPGGHIHWSFLENKEIHRMYESQLASLGLCDTVIASVSLRKS